MVAIRFAMQCLGGRSDGREPLGAVFFDAGQQLFFQLFKELFHQFEVVVVAVALVDERVEMPLDVGYLELLVIGVGLGKVIDNLGSTERFEPVLGEIVFVDEGVENRYEKFAVEIFLLAYGANVLVAHAQNDTEPVDDRYQ